MRKRINREKRIYIFLGFKVWTRRRQLHAQKRIKEIRGKTNKRKRRGRIPRGEGGRRRSFLPLRGASKNVVTTEEKQKRYFTPTLPGAPERFIYDLLIIFSMNCFHAVPYRLYHCQRYLLGGTTESVTYRRRHNHKNNWMIVETIH